MEYVRRRLMTRLLTMNASGATGRHSTPFPSVDSTLSMRKRSWRVQALCVAATMGTHAERLFFGCYDLSGSALLVLRAEQYSRCVMGSPKFGLWRRVTSYRRGPRRDGRCRLGRRSPTVEFTTAGLSKSLVLLSAVADGLPMAELPLIMEVVGGNRRSSRLSDPTYAVSALSPKADSRPPSTNVRYSGAKRTPHLIVPMSAYDPLWTCAPKVCCTPWESELH